MHRAAGQSGERHPPHVVRRPRVEQVAEVVRNDEEHRDGAHAVERRARSRGGARPATSRSPSCPPPPCQLHCLMKVTRRTATGGRSLRWPSVLADVLALRRVAAQCVCVVTAAEGADCGSETLAVPRRHRAGVGLPAAQVADPDRRAAPNVRAGAAAVARRARRLVLEDRRTTVAGRRRERHRHAVVPGRDLRDRRRTGNGVPAATGSRPEPRAPTAARTPPGSRPSTLHVYVLPAVRLVTVVGEACSVVRLARATVARRARDPILSDRRATVTCRRRVRDRHAAHPGRGRPDRRRTREPSAAAAETASRPAPSAPRAGRNRPCSAPSRCTCTSCPPVRSRHGRRRRVLGLRVALATVTRRASDPVLGDRGAAVAGRRRVRDRHTAQPGRRR